MSLLLTLGLGGGATPPTPPSGGDTPYMNLLLPTVSVTLGPLYATEVNAAFLRVDSHDHSDGYGKLVGTNGLNINAALSFHGNDATNLNSAGFNIQSPTAGLVGQVYMSGQDLYCVDGAGNVIQITAAGAVNVSGLGSWTGLIAPAQAGYNSVTKKFSLQSNTTGPKFGLLEIGDILLYPGDPNLGTLPYIRIATPNSGVSTYTLGLPTAAPYSGIGTKQTLLSMRADGQLLLGPTAPISVTRFLRMDTNGVPAADVVQDNSTLVISGTTLQVATGGITAAQLANNNVTADKLIYIPGNQTTYSATGVNHVTSSGVAVNCQQSTLHPGTNARPILIAFGPRTDGAQSNIRAFSNFPQLTFTIKMDGSAGVAGSAKWLVDCWNNGSAQNYAPWYNFIIPPGTITSGIHTWTMTIDSTGTNFNADYTLSAQEL